MELELERLDLNLQEYIDRLRMNRQQLSVPAIRDLTRQLLQAVAHCHSRLVHHRDIKPQNIMLEEAKNRLVLIDFNLARRIAAPAVLASAVTPKVVTVNYRAPEILLFCSSGGADGRQQKYSGGGHYGTAVDMWSVGCVLGELITQAPLFPPLDEAYSEIGQLMSIFRRLGTPSADVFLRIALGSGSNPSSLKWPRFEPKPIASLLPASWSSETAALDLLSKLLAYDPVARPSAREALKHPFVAV